MLKKVSFLAIPSSCQANWRCI